MQGKPHEPLALIIGAQKAGTTSLFSYLGQHPEIAPCVLKEPGYFVDPDKLAKGNAWYINLFNKKNADGRIPLEATPEYTAYPEKGDAASSIKCNWGENVKFIYIIRHPIERIESQVRHNILRGGVDLDKGGLKQEYISRTQYSKQIEQYKKAYPEHNILILTLEELERSPSNVMERVCDHLDISKSHNFQDISTPQNVMGLSSFLSPIWREAKRIPVLGASLDAVIPHRMRNIIRRATTIRHEPRGRYQTNQQERNEIMHHLRDDLTRLREVHGVDVHGWWDIHP